jgi:hypothetical protein
MAILVTEASVRGCLGRNPWADPLYTESERLKESLQKSNATDDHLAGLDCDSR